MRKSVAALALFAFSVRLYNLDAIPIAGDESVYLRWTEIILHQKQWFISLLDGKQPLAFWLYALATLLWPNDPLWAARLVSVAAGACGTLGIFAIGKRLAGTEAGVVAASLFAVLPYALVYDRLAYTESLVNLAGITIVYFSLACFQSPHTSRGAVAGLGFALGLGFFCKSTALLFWFFPLVAALWWGRQRKRRAVLELGAAYGVALLFPVISRIATPRAPTMQAHGILHQADFLLTPGEFLRNPMAVAPANLRLLGGYLTTYLTLPLCLAALVALVWLARKRPAAILSVATVSLFPLVFQVFVLQKIFPTRYPYPHVWPLLVAVGIAFSDLRGRIPKTAAIVAAAILAVFPGIKAYCQVDRPGECMHEEDARMFLGSGPSAGFGVREAADFLTAEASRGPLTVLTDPIWGSPADPMFVYLNQRYGIEVHEAWWTTISPQYPILPPVPVELVKSHYERVAAGMLDPSKAGRVYYVTETHYNPPAAVMQRQPNAERLAAFPKPNGRNSIDVYRLK